MSFYIQPFSFNYFCKGISISYNLISPIDSILNSLTKAITFNPNLLSFTVQSYSQKDVGTYQYQVIGSAVINGTVVNQTLNITISIV